MTTASGGAPRRTLPVVRWLQASSIAAGIGMALVATPGIAAADAGADSSTNDTRTQVARDANPGDTGQRRGEATKRPALSAHRPGSAVPAAATDLHQPESTGGAVVTEDSGTVTAAREAAVRVVPDRSAARTPVADGSNSVAGQELWVAPHSAAGASPNTPVSMDVTPPPNAPERTSAVLTAALTVPAPVSVASAPSAAVGKGGCCEDTAGVVSAFRPVVVINSVFDVVARLIGDLPGGPISSLLEGSLLLVRRILVLPFSGWTDAPACVSTGDCSGQDLSGQDLSGLNLVRVDFTEACWPLRLLISVSSSLVRSSSLVGTTTSM